MAQDQFYKKNIPEVKEEVRSKSQGVRVKFNFSLASPTYNPKVALSKAREEKSYVAFEMQSQIDLNITANFYPAGTIEYVPEDFYHRFAERTVETYCSLFGNFQGEARKLAKRKTVPYLLKVDEQGNLLDPMQRELDLYPNSK